MARLTVHPAAAVRMGHTVALALAVAAFKTAPGAEAAGVVAEPAPLTAIYPVREVGHS